MKRVHQDKPVGILILIVLARNYLKLPDHIDGLEQLGSASFLIEKQSRTLPLEALEIDNS